MRRSLKGDEVSFAVNRNINYTNVCYFKCQFCAFSKGKLSENLRGRPYDLDLDEIRRRVREAWDRGATEVCMQGGIHPEYSGRDLPGDRPERSRRPVRTCTSTPSRRWKSGRAPLPWNCRWTTTCSG
ncbi:MAG: radical SAM protein [Gammaproteobacteria bacterium]|nr:radical SAM protein [Gammaproteobacteria bacterium]